MENWAEIRRLHRAERMSINAIVRRLGVARNTVRAALRSSAPPSYQRARQGWSSTPWSPRSGSCCGSSPTWRPPWWPSASAGSTPSGCCENGWPSGGRCSRPPIPVSARSIGRASWPSSTCGSPDAVIPLGHGQAAKGWVIVGVAGFSRFIGAWMIPSRQPHDVLGGHLQVLRQFGVLPRAVVWDQEPAIGRWRGRDMVFTRQFQAFRGTLGIGAILCQRGDPEAKGLVERANGYLETSFLPGRSFADVADFNRQLSGWLVSANHRIHATTKVRPRDALFEEPGSMLAFPPVLPDTTLRWSTRLAWDHYVRLDTNDYSVNPRYVGRRIEIRVDLDVVVVTCENTEVARHRRCLARNQAILAPEHARILRAMREEKAAVAEAPADEVEERDLAVYDQITEEVA